MVVLPKYDEFLRGYSAMRQSGGILSAMFWGFPRRISAA